MAPGRAAMLPAEPAATRGRDLAGIAALGAVLVAWRVCQVAFDWPAPVLNALVPLAAMAWILWRVAGDPFAIRTSILELRQEGVR
jgi:hypothetical protein